MNTVGENTAALLNRECHCTLTDVEALRLDMDSQLDLARPIWESHPHLFSSVPVFLASAHLAQMQRVIEAVEQAASLPAYQQQVLAAAPPIARMKSRNHGVFFGFDFHIGADGPKLIEINTNAGGAFLNVMARKAQRACCDAASDYFSRLPSGENLEDSIVAMFREEWRLARGERPLRSIAIVDDDPAAQFLFPEFRLALKLFARHGIRARIADLADLEIDDHDVRVDGEVMDLIYNRHTDFYLDTQRSRVLREACEKDLAVITPHPRAHALFASKRNLALLSDAVSLARLGLAPELIETLVKVIPATEEVRGCEESWWRDRKRWFFKPQSGFGSRGAYRGDKMTRRVLGEIMHGGYVAQRYAPPGERHGSADATAAPFKADIRCYTYRGRIQLVAARLYQGQTTNFRTPGGGFAPVYVVGDERLAS
jgi:hypothetical protein